MPSGNGSTAFTSTGSAVTCVASPPSTAMRHTCDVPLRAERKYTLLPSGAKRAPESAAGWLVRRLTEEPSVAAIHTSLEDVFASTSGVATVKVASLPSGETAASEMRSKESMSSTVKGWGWRDGFAVAAVPAAASTDEVV